MKTISHVNSIIQVTGELKKQKIQMRGTPMSTCMLLTKINVLLPRLKDIMDLHQNLSRLLRSLHLCPGTDWITGLYSSETFRFLNYIANRFPWLSILNISIMRLLSLWSCKMIYKTSHSSIYIMLVLFLWRRLTWIYAIFYNQLFNFIDNLQVHFLSWWKWWRNQ